MHDFVRLTEEVNTAMETMEGDFGDLLAGSDDEVYQLPEGVSARSSLPLCRCCEVRGLIEFQPSDFTLLPVFSVQRARLAQPLMGKPWQLVRSRSAPPEGQRARRREAVRKGAWPAE